MRRGLPFWLLRLESARCPTCKRDNVWRRRRRPSDYCRWCGASMIDWASFTRSMQRLSAVMGTSFESACRGAIATMNAFVGALYGTVWTVDVETATHDDLRAGNTCTRISRVQVLAPDETEAKLVACQMACHDGRMATRATVRGPEELRAEEGARQITQAYRMDNPLAHAVRMRKLEEPQ